LVARDSLESSSPGVANFSGNFHKFFSDVWSLLEIKVIVTRRYLMFHVLGALILPLSMLYWATAMSPERFESSFRILVGTLILGIGQAVGSNVGLATLQDRFTRRLRLLVTMPVSKVSYAFGTLAYGALQSAVLVTLILLFAWLAGADYSLDWTLAPLILATVVTMTGATLFAVSLVPDINSGIIANSMFGVVFVVLSPVFYTFDNAPRLFKWLGWVSPFRYAADGIEKGLNGQSASWSELTILSGIALAVMIAGTRILRWRDI